MSDVDEPYENTLSPEELRCELRQAWNEQHALTKALRDCPDVPPIDALRVLINAAMNIHKPDVLEIGKAEQRRLGGYPFGAIPAKTEYEAAAGLWVIIRDALKASREEV